MRGNKTLAVGLMVVGVVVLLGSAMADLLGLGVSPFVFGYRQLAGSVVGAVLAMIGGVLYWRVGRAD